MATNVTKLHKEMSLKKTLCMVFIPLNIDYSVYYYRKSETNNSFTFTFLYLCFIKYYFHLK